MFYAKFRSHRVKNEKVMTKTLSQLTAPVRKRSMNIGDKLQQRQIASFIPENFCENLCLCNRILLSQQVVQIQSDLIISRLVAATKFCCGDKDFHKHSPCRPHQAICRYDVTPQRVAESPDLHTRSDLSPRRIAATCGLVCSDFVREQHALK